MKIRIYETDFEGHPLDCSGEYFSGKTALDIVEGMTLNPFQSHLTPHGFMAEMLAAIGTEGVSFAGRFGNGGTGFLAEADRPRICRICH